MAKANVTALANTLMNSLGDATQIGNYYDEIVQEIGRGMFQGVLSLVGAAFVATTKGTGTAAFPTTAVRLLALFYDDEQLAMASSSEAQDYDLNWRKTEGQPAAYVTADEDQRTISLVPIPHNDGQAIGGVTPFTYTTWPAENLMFLYTENRADVHQDEELALALEIIAREYARDSDHHDATASQAAKQLSTMFLQMNHSR